MYDLNLVDETFDKFNTSAYRLSIQFSLNGFSFCILDSIQNKFVLLRNYIFDAPTEPELINNLENVFEDEILSLPFKKTIVAYQTHKFLLIPNPFFSKNNVKTYFEIQHSLDHLDELHTYPFNDKELTAAYAIPNPAVNIILEHQPKAKFITPSVPFIEMASGLSGSKKKCILISLREKLSDILVVEGDQILFFNTFQINKTNDLLYYLLFVLKNQGIQQEEATVNIINYKENQIDFNSLKKYIKKIDILSYQDEELFSYLIKKKYIREFLTLFNAIS